MSAMTRPRTLVADLVRDAMPAGVTVKDKTETPDNVRGILVMVRQDSIGRGTTQGTRTYVMSLFVLVGKTKPGKADDDLDDAAIDVLYALEQAAEPGLLIGEAERATFENGAGEATWPCYRIPLTVHTTKESTS